MRILYRNYTIEMRGLNNFACPQLNEHGYSTIKQIESLINKHIKQQEPTK